MWQAIEQVGSDVLNYFLRKLEEVGEAVLVFVEGIFPPYYLAWDTFARQLAFWGIESLPISVIASTTAAMTTSYLLAQQVADVGGAGKYLIGGAVAAVMARDLGPVIIGLILSGRVGASITSQLGSMKITEQVDALKALGVDPFQYLIFPRFVASILMSPMVVAISVYVAIILAYYPAQTAVNLTWTSYTFSIQTIFRQHYLREGLWKATVFGAIIAVVSSYKGLAVREGAVDLGHKVTEAVVTSMIYILISNILLTIFIFRQP